MKKENKYPPYSANPYLLDIILFFGGQVKPNDIQTTLYLFIRTATGEKGTSLRREGQEQAWQVREKEELAIWSPIN